MNAFMVGRNIMCSFTIDRVSIDDVANVVHKSKQNRRHGAEAITVG